MPCIPLFSMNSTFPTCVIPKSRAFTSGRGIWRAVSANSMRIKTVRNRGCILEVTEVIPASSPFNSFRLRRQSLRAGSHSAEKRRVSGSRIPRINIRPKTGGWPLLPISKHEGAASAALRTGCSLSCFATRVCSSDMRHPEARAFTSGARDLACSDATL